MGNGAAEEDWLWDLNLDVQPYRREDHSALAEWGLRGGDIADGAESLSHGLLLLFLRYSTLDWAEGEGRTVCICGYSKGL